MSTNLNPWRKVVERPRSKVARSRTGNSVYYLRLECGHQIKAMDEDAGSVKRKRCRQCGDAIREGKVSP